jgi:hypothetical protein
MLLFLIILGVTQKGRAIRYIFCEVPIGIGTSQKDAATIPHARPCLILYLFNL